MELTMVTIIILLLLIVILLSILILAISPARTLALRIVGLILSGLFIIINLVCCVVAIYFGWNILELFFINQVFWWVELFIAICGLVVATSILISAIRLFGGSWAILANPEENFEKFGISNEQGCLSMLVISLSTFLASSGIFAYQTLVFFRSGSWRSISVLDSILFSFQNKALRGPHDTFSPISLWYSISEFLPLCVGVIFIGILFFVALVTVLDLQANVIRAFSGTGNYKDGIDDDDG